MTKSGRWVSFSSLAVRYHGCRAVRGKDLVRAEVNRPRRAVGLRSKQCIRGRRVLAASHRLTLENRGLVQMCFLAAKGQNAIDFKSLFLNSC